MSRVLRAWSLDYGRSLEHREPARKVPWPIRLEHALLSLFTPGVFLLYALRLSRLDDKDTVRHNRPFMTGLVLIVLAGLKRVSWPLRSRRRFRSLIPAVAVSVPGLRWSWRSTRSMDFLSGVK